MRDRAGSAAAPAATRRICLRWGSFIIALPDHAQDDWRVALIATLIQVRLCSECSPADGMSAAAEMMGLRHVPTAALPARLHQLREQAEGPCRRFLQRVRAVIQTGYRPDRCWRTG